MTVEGLIDAIQIALDEPTALHYEVFMDVMNERRYQVEADEDGIRRIYSREGARVYDRTQDDARDFVRHISVETKRALIVAFTGGAKSKPRVIVGKARLIPFPDRKLAPAPAP